MAVPHFAATTFGVIGFSDAIRQEMKKEGQPIGETYVFPDTMNTGMFGGSKLVKGTSMLPREKFMWAVLKAGKKNRPLCAVPHGSLGIAIPLMKLILPINAMDAVCRSLGMWTVYDLRTGCKDMTEIPGAKFRGDGITQELRSSKILWKFSRSV